MVTSLDCLTLYLDRRKMGSWKALKIKKKEKGTALTSLKPPFRTRHNNELESMKSTQLRSNEQR